MMNKISIAALLLALCPLLLTGCPDRSAPAMHEGLTSFKVSVTSESGSKKERLNTNGDFDLTVTVKALDETGELMKDYDGVVRFKMKPGLFSERCEGDLHLDDDPGSVEVEMKDGQLKDQKLSVVRSWGDAVVWVEDTETLVTGVSQTVYLKLPTLAGVQRPAHSRAVIESSYADLCVAYEQLDLAPPPDNSPWQYNSVYLSKAPLVVTHSQIGGFFVTDLNEPEFGNIYVYTRGIPRLKRGDRLLYLSGSITEFYGLTELSFPAYAVDCHNYTMPEPRLLNTYLLDCAQEMEKYEGGLVRMENISPSATIDEESYLNYAQWPAYAPDGAMITLSTEAAMPGFDPRLPEAQKQTFKSITGILRQHYSANPEWILVPRDACDIECDFEIEGYKCERPADCDAAQPATDCE